MDPHDLRHVRGAAELLPVAVDAAVRKIEETHRAVERAAYRRVARVPRLRGPAYAAAALHHSVTSLVYSAIHLVNASAGIAVRHAFDHLESRVRARDEPAQRHGSGAPGDQKVETLPPHRG